jgi:hypothetical protein
MTYLQQIENLIKKLESDFINNRIDLVEIQKVIKKELDSPKMEDPAFDALISFLEKYMQPEAFVNFCDSL